MTISSYGGAGGSGGAGLYFSATGALTNKGSVYGGNGGNGGNIPSAKYIYHLYFGAGAAGGAGVFLAHGGTVNNVSIIDGGYGGYGGSDANGGAGGAGVIVAADGVVSNTGSISAAAGGHGGAAVSPGRPFVGFTGGNGGAGGAGVMLLGGGRVSNRGAIEGGDGGEGNEGGGGGVGGGGAVLAAGGTIASAGMITGGAGGAASGYTYYNGGAGGSGGSGISLAAGGRVVLTGGIVSGGAGGAGEHGGQYHNPEYGLYSSGGYGGAGGAGVAIGGGGSLTNKGGIIIGGAGGVGGQSYFKYLGGAGGAGGAGVDLADGGSVVNAVGTIAGADGGAGGDGNLQGAAGDGVSMARGGVVTNGASALIIGGEGVHAGATGVAIVTNYGTIQGTGGVAVQFESAFDRLVIEAGSSLLGVAKGGGGTLELAGGAGTITGLGVQYSGFGSYVVDTGSSWTLVGPTTLAATANVVNNGTLILSGSLANAGTITSVRGVGLTLTAGSELTNTAKSVVQGTIGVYAGGTGGATITNFGTLQGAEYSVEFASSGDRLIAEGGSALAGAAVGGGGILEFAGARGGGTISGLGTQYRGFGAYVVDAGATWLAEGLNTPGAALPLTVYGSVLNLGLIVSRGTGVVMGDGGSLTTVGALIEGTVGVYAGPNGAATVINEGTIEGTGGVALQFESAADRLIISGSGPFQSFVGAVHGGGGTLEVDNFGEVSGLGTHYSGFSNYLINVGFIDGYNTIASGATLTVTGELLNNSTIVNFGSVGVVLRPGTQLVNESGVDNHAGRYYFADIQAMVGVYAGPGGGATVFNSGTIQGTSGVAVRFASAADILSIGNGSKLIGVAQGGGGTVEWVGGISGTISGLGTQYSGFGSYLDYGNWNLAGTNTLKAGDRFTIGGLLTIEGSLANAGYIEGGGGIVLTSSGSLVDSGALTLSGAFSNGGRVSLLDGGRVSLTGAIVNGGEISLAGVAQITLLRFAGPSATLTGGGSIGLGNSLENHLVVTGASCTLTNTDNRIVGAGVIGGSFMTLVNQSAGAIIGVGSAGLTINTGTNTIANAGLIEADGNTVTIVSSLNNTGKLYALNGTLTLDRAVTGTGVAYINAGTLVAANAFSETVAFIGGAGLLQLSQSRTYAGRIVGFSTTGGTSLDLRDIGFVSSSEATFSGTTSRGVLTVTDGTHTARISLVGDYAATSFTASSDSHGGVTITDPAAPASPRAFVAAMAGMGAGTVASASVANQAHNPLEPALAVVR